MGKDTGMNKYFKFPAESDLGIGIQYIEFDNDNWPIRQAECYGDRWFNSSHKCHQELGGIGLCDQPLTNPDMEIASIIDAQEFESFWALSNKKLLEYQSSNSNRVQKVSS
jgi:hypothetical protein